MTTSFSVISPDKFFLDVISLTKQLGDYFVGMRSNKSDLAEAPRLILVGILRGGWFYVQMEELLARVEFPVRSYAVEAISYNDEKIGTASGVRLFGFERFFSEVRATDIVVFVDEIIDSGATWEAIKKKCEEECTVFPNPILAALYRKSGKNQPADVLTARIMQRSKWVVIGVKEFGTRDNNGCPIIPFSLDNAFFSESMNKGLVDFEEHFQTGLKP